MLSAYELACGYIQRIEKKGVVVTLWREHGVYHVRAHEYSKGRIQWNTFRLLKDAHKSFADMVKTHIPS
jgi:hypothetical protein